LAEARPPGFLHTLAQQFADFMVGVLLVAALLSLFLGELVDFITIIAIVVVNAILGALQTHRAERSLAALRDLAAPVARVVRAGQPSLVGAEELVPGDLVLLEPGDRVPADLRIVEAWALEADESPLTGESLPVDKRAELAFAPSTALGDRRNLLFSSTTVVRGTGRALVVATGMDTELGKVAAMLRPGPREATPLEGRLSELGRVLVCICLAVCVLVVVLGLGRGEAFAPMLLTGISLAVAAIPEGLPAVVTIALASGVKRMADRRVIIRRLPAVEALGCTTVICTDKTGTLTENRMTLRELHPDGPAELAAGLLCSNARLAMDGSSASGDPTEAALVLAAAASRLTRDAVEAAYPRMGEIPFEPERRRMSTLHSRSGRGVLDQMLGQDGRHFLITKGAPDAVLPLCTARMAGNRRVPMGPAARDECSRRAEELAGRGLRVLALAYRPLLRSPGGRLESELERDMCFLTLAAIADPPRAEVPEALRVCRRAGVRVLMLTGDHPATARSIAGELGLLEREGSVVTGAALEAMDDRQLARTVGTAAVFARVSPADKLRLVRAVRAQGHIVAMTGDGINDAPALKEADIGVAMGQTGTDVAREAASMVLADDDFTGIVQAILEGRAVYDNIRKFLRYLLACNAGEILVMLGASLLNQPLPLLPVQILWVNLVTDGLPAIALGLGKPDPGVADRPPRPPGESIFARRLGVKIAGRGILIGLGSLAAFLYGRHAFPVDLTLARTMCFATLVLAQLLHAFDCRSEHRSLAETGLLANPPLVAAVGCSALMLLAVIYLPALQPVFRTMPLDFRAWAAVVAAAAFSQVLVGMRRVLRHQGWLR
jgi:Ca2+-transporting ATPase